MTLRTTLHLAIWVPLVAFALYLGLAFGAFLLHGVAPSRAQTLVIPPGTRGPVAATATVYYQSMEALARLKPYFDRRYGSVTAGNSSQITDGAAAVLVMSEEKAKELGLTPRARFHAFALAGVDPVMMLTGPIPSTAKVLERAGLISRRRDGQRRPCRLRPEPLRAPRVWPRGIRLGVDVLLCASRNQLEMGT